MVHRLCRPLVAVLVVFSVMVAGCGVGGPLDPPGTSPELAGTWADVGSSSVGCLHVDNTGDLTKATGGALLHAELGVEELNFDGAWRTGQFGSFPVEYAAIAEVTRTGDVVSFAMSLSFRSLGVSVGTYEVLVEGMYDGATIDGTVTLDADIPLADVEYSVSSDAVLARDGC